MLGECPSTSFHENLVFQCIKRILSSENIPFTTDTYGNILARIEGTKPQNKPVAFVAHMDHPGFEIVQKENSNFIAKALGGVPEWTFTKKTPVKIVGNDNEIIKGYLNGRFGSINDRMVYVQTDNYKKVNISAGVIFDVEGFNKLFEERVLNYLINL